ncbi:MAG: hypothetical protein ACYCYI_02790 [Saccharofermentanales bacterium]
MINFLILVKINSSCKMTIVWDDQIIANNLTKDTEINLNIEQGNHYIQFLTVRKIAKNNNSAGILKRSIISFERGGGFGFQYGIGTTKTDYGLNVFSRKALIEVEVSYQNITEIVSETGYFLTEIKNHHGVNIINERKNILPKEELANFILGKSLTIIFSWGLGVICAPLALYISPNNRTYGISGAIISVILWTFCLVMVIYNFRKMIKFIKQYNQ